MPSSKLKLGDKNNRTKRSTVVYEPVTKTLAQNSPVLESTVACLVACTSDILLFFLAAKLICGGRADLVRLPVIAFIGLSFLPLKQLVFQAVPECFNVWPFPSWIWSLNVQNLTPLIEMATP
jgi:hypothetical protein